MKIIFMGTPQFAVPSLDILVRSEYDVVGVVTSTDKLLGRGKKKLVYSAVKEYALEHDIPVLQPKNLKSEEFLEQLRSLKADLQVIVAFRMLPVVVWDMPPMGSINLHGSLLPAFRGAAPINWAVIRGAKVTGLTTFKLKHEIDTGSVIFQESILINPHDTAGDLHDKLMYLGAPLVLKTVRAIASGQVEYRDQDDSMASHAPKVFHEDGRIDLEKSTVEIRNLIHGLSPYPAAWMMYNDKKLKIFRAAVSSSETSGEETGKLFKGSHNEALLACKDGNLRLSEVQLEGKSRMKGEDFANGYLG